MILNTVHRKHEGNFQQKSMEPQGIKIIYQRFMFQIYVAQFQKREINEECCLLGCDTVTFQKNILPPSKQTKKKTNSVALSPRANYTD
jgi:transaldolase